ncbi:MAG: translocation/assembly module TamB domain-containing protein [bacterium]
MKLFSLFNKRRSIILFFFLFIIIFSLSSILFLTSPYFDNIVKNYAQNYLTKILHEKTTIKKLKISFFAPQISITDLKLKGFASVKNINIYFGRFNFFDRKIVINKIYVDNPAVKVILKNNKILNYKGFQKTVKAFSKKSSFSLISASVNNITVHNGDLKLNDISKKLNLTVKKFRFNFFVKKGSRAFFKNGYGQFLSYNAPYIHLKTARYDRLFSSSSKYIHIFDNFVKVKNLSLSANFFQTATSGIIYFKKHLNNNLNNHSNNSANSISDSQNYFNKHSDLKNGVKQNDKKNQSLSFINSIINSIPIHSLYITSDLNIQHLSKLPKNIKPFLINGGLNLKIHVSGNLYNNLKINSKIELTNFVFSGADIKKGLILANYSVKKGKESENNKNLINKINKNDNNANRNIFPLGGVVKFPKIKLTMFKGKFYSQGQINLRDMQGKFNSVLNKLSIGDIIDFYAAEKTPQFTGNAYGKVKTFIKIGKNFYVANLEHIIVKKPVELFKYKSKGVRKIISVNYLNNINLSGNTLINNNSVVLSNIRGNSKTENVISSGKISYQNDDLSILIEGQYKSMPEISLFKKYKSRYFSPASSGTVKVHFKGNFHAISFFITGNLKSLYINKYFKNYGGKCIINVLPHGTVYFKKVLLKEKQAVSSSSNIVNGKNDGNITNKTAVKSPITKNMNSGNNNLNNRGIVSFSGKIFKVNKRSRIKGNFNALNIHFYTNNIAGMLNAKGRIGGAFSNPNIYIALFSRKVNIYGQYLYNINSNLIINKRNLKIKKLSAVYKNFTQNGHSITPINNLSAKRVKRQAGQSAAVPAIAHSITPSAVSSSASSIIYGSGIINFKASKTRNYNYNANIYANNIKLSSLNLIKNLIKNKNVNNVNIKGVLNFNLHLGGFFKFPTVSGNISAKKIYLNNYYLNTVGAKLLSSNKKIKININALNGKIDTAASIELKKGYPFKFLSKIKDASINYKKTLVALNGGVYGSGKLTSLKNSDVFGKFDYVYIKHGSMFLKNVKNIRLAYMNRSLTISGFKLKGNSNYFQIRGDITGKRYNLVVNDKTSLSILDLLSSKILNSSGFISSSAVIFGPVSDPKIYGYANIKKGLIETYANPQYTVSRLRGHITFNKNLIMLNKIHLRLLNGFFSVNGFISMKDFKPDSYHLTTQFYSAVYRQSNYFYAIAGGTLRYNGNNKTGLISGHIKIKKAIFDKKINFTSFLTKYKRYDFIRPAAKKNIFNPSLSINVKADNSIFIKNNIADAVFNADLNVLGTLYNPVIMGVVTAKKGNIYFRGDQFKLYYANIDFNNPYKISPSFAISAYTHISQYIIRLNADGSLLNFNVNFSSTPPLSELSIVSMLALGVTSSSIYANSAGSIAASEAASAIGGGLERSITGTISSYFGFKNLSVTPSYSDITHNAAPQVLVTKQLTNKLSISYSNIISSQSSQSVKLTYKLARHISLIGEWENNELAPNNSNVYSEIGGDIEFHFRFY